MRNEIMIREPDLYFESLHHELNNFLRDTMLTPMFSNPLALKKASVWRPLIEVKQTDNEYKVKIQLPGVKKEDIDVELDNEFMTVTAEIDEEKEEKEEKEKNEKYHTCEFRYGKYKRTISFDQPIKQDKAKAEYKNGVLKIIIPKQHADDIKHAKRLEIE